MTATSSASLSSYANDRLRTEEIRYWITIAITLFRLEFDYISRLLFEELGVGPPPANPLLNAQIDSALLEHLLTRARIREPYLLTLSDSDRIVEQMGRGRGDRAAHYHARSYTRGYVLYVVHRFHNHGRWQNFLDRIALKVQRQSTATGFASAILALGHGNWMPVTQDTSSGFVGLAETLAAIAFNWTRGEHLVVALDAPPTLQKAGQAADRVVERLLLLNADD
jgi:hypothetical protein